MLTLQTGSKKHQCPNCSKKTFVIYVNDETGQPIADFVGRCDRESKCNYHFKPKEYFEQNPNEQTTYKFNIRPNIKPKKKKPSGNIPFDEVKQTLKNYEQNNFVQFLLSKFDSGDVEKAIAKYFVGTFQHKYGAFTCFPYVTSKMKVKSGKLIRYEKTGSRSKGKFDTSSLSSQLKKTGKLKADFELGKIFFGEHLINLSEKPLAIVESEKTAIICSILIKKYTWLAVGGLSYLTMERLKRLAGNEIVLYPDAEKRAFELWRDKAIEARSINLDVTCSDIIEKQTTDEQKAKQYDLADFLLESLKPSKNKFDTNAESAVAEIAKDTNKIKVPSFKEITQKLNEFHKQGVELYSDEDEPDNIFAVNDSLLRSEDVQFFKDNNLEILYIWQANLLKQNLPTSERTQLDYELNEQVALGGDVFALLEITRPIYRDLLTK